MKRHGGLFEPVVSTANLWRAWREFRRGKRNRPSVAEFELDAERHVLRLHRELSERSYRPGPFRLSFVREPKRRLIAAAPVRDRVVHHAVHRVVEPLLAPSLVDHTYACLVSRGAHRALLRFLRSLREHRFALCLDIRRYYPSIDREILKELLATRLKDERLLHLLSILVDHGEGIYRRPEVAKALDLPPGFPPPGCGIPIGNLTSQWWGNLYLSGLDHFVKRELKIPDAQRYMDDIALFDDSRARLIEARHAAAEWLLRERRLELKDPSAQVQAATQRFRYLGQRVSRAGIDPTPEALARMRRRLRSLVLHGSLATIERSIASYRGLIGMTGPAGVSGVGDKS